MSKKKELAVNGVAGVFSDLFKEINFKEMDGMIEKLGDSSGNLSDHEKVKATEVIREWRREIVTRIENRIRDTEEGMCFLNPECAPEKVYGKVGNLAEGMEEEMARRTGTGKLYRDYVTALDEVLSHKKVKPSSKYEHNEDMTYEQNELAKKEYEISVIKYNSKSTRLARTAGTAFARWISAMSDHQDVKDLLNAMKKYKKTAISFKDECLRKETLAAIAVNISDPTIRTTLKEMMEFSLKI